MFMTTSSMTLDFSDTYSGRSNLGGESSIRYGRSSSSKLLNLHAHLRKPKSISFTFMKGGPKGFWLDHVSLFQGLLSCSFLFGLVLAFISFLATHKVIPLGG